ncbi:MAG TPA: UDP-N-acetylglucosamine 1-carboxyvinyltransferase [Lachnospiraceae bacterium]|nr:UDP-N-acetylglucosamine 1-carboxyvinyltransferase [Lachnospiraceae bacterium]
MEQYVIKGGIPLVGEVEIAGAKNAALPIISAAIMTDEVVTLENLPDVNDINVLLEAIEGIGARVDRIDRHTVKINGSTIQDCSVEYECIKKIRASYYLLGALLGKYNNAEVPLPGGCNIGSRPIDQHLKGFRAIGAQVSIEHGTIIAKCDHMVGAHIFMDIVSVGATINIMMAASRAQGRTIIENAAKEPHVVDVANFLNSMGADIKGAGTDVIRIKGVSSFHGCNYMIVPDMIEAGTYMMAAAATKGDVIIKNVIPKHLEAITAKLLEIGCEVEESDDSVRVVAAKRLNRTHVKTQPYPGFPTDMQPQMSVVLALAAGTSIVTESIFENRFKYVDELTRMGANIKVEGNTAIIDGVPNFTGARISSPDLRAGAALVIAGLEADGFTVIDDIVYIQRGYEDFEGKLRGLGAEIERVTSEREIDKFELRIG